MFVFGFAAGVTCVAVAEVECEEGFCAAALSSLDGLKERCDGSTLSVPSWKYDTKTKTAKMMGMHTTVMAVKCTWRRSIVVVV